MPDQDRTLISHVKEGFTALDLIKKVWWLVIALVVFGSSLRGAYTFVMKDAPDALSTHSSQIENLEANYEGLGSRCEGLAVKHDTDMTVSEQQHQETLSEFDTKLDYMVCSRRERDRAREGLPAERNCEDIFLEIRSTGGGGN